MSKTYPRVATFEQETHALELADSDNIAALVEYLTTENIAMTPRLIGWTMWHADEYNRWLNEYDKARHIDDDHCPRCGEKLTGYYMTNQDQAIILGERPKWNIKACENRACRDIYGKQYLNTDGLIRARVERGK